jgi:RNA polymerase-associated protein RTF1
VSQQEYARYLTTLESEKVRKPNADDVEHKKESLKAAREYILSDKEVADMIAKKKELKNTISNVAMEKTMLHTKLEQAKSDENHQEVERLKSQIADLEERASNVISAGKLNIWADLNKKNREKDKVEMKEAERIALLARKKLGAIATDPFARRRTTPKLVHTPGSG